MKAVFGCLGPSLTKDEFDFFKSVKPMGIILFKRNCKSKNQVRDLILSIKECISEKTHILIDQEGGRVVRLSPPIWDEIKPASSFKTKEEVFNNSINIGKMLSSQGIDINIAPCLDLIHKGSDPIIGDRSFSSDPNIVFEFGAQMIKGLKETGVKSVIKHIPGHGRATEDSHKTLPIIDHDIDLLKKTDFLPFKKIVEHLKEIDYLAMTAHVIYSKLDPKNPVTHSKIVIDKIIRDFIGFKGQLITDCLTMDALSGSYYERGMKALDAGCDILLYCGTNIFEMEEIVKALRRT